MKPRHRRLTWSEFKQLHRHLNESEILKLFNIEEEQWRLFEAEEKRIVEIKNQKIIDKAQALNNQLIEVFTSRGGYYFYPPLPPPGFSLWLDAYDSNTITTNTSSFVTSWQGKTYDPSLHKGQRYGRLSPLRFDTTTGFSEGITVGSATKQEYAPNLDALNNRSIQFRKFDVGGIARYPFMSGSLNLGQGTGRSLSYGSGSMTLFITLDPVTNHNPIDGHFSVADVFGRNDTTTDGTWNVGLGRISTTQRYFSQIIFYSQSAGYTVRHLDSVNTENNLPTSSKFPALIEVQVHKTGSTANDVSVRLIEQRGDGTTRMKSGLQTNLKQVIAANDDIVDGSDNVQILDFNASKASDLNYYQILQYPKALNESETKQVYEYLNYSLGTNYKYTSSFG